MAKTRPTRPRAALLRTAAVAGGMLTTAACRAEPPTTAALTAGSATAPAVAPRDPATVMRGLQTDLAAFRSVFAGPQVLTDGAARQAAAAAVLPSMRKVYADFGALAEVQPDAKDEADSAQAQFTDMMATLGDPDAAARLSAKANSSDPAVATDGKAQQLLVQWWTTAQDPAAQGKVADQAEVLARAHTDSVPLTQQLLAMSEIGAATPALAARMQSLVTDVMRNPAVDGAKQQIADDQRLAALTGRPMTISGKLVDGRDFTTADWKGKVILIDFWATWCAPCRAELPRVEKVYAEDHAKGLEILGVSNDQSADDLTKFLAADGRMPWPELFDPQAGANWNPVTTGYGINSIPAMFLIDRKGVCRTVEAGEAMEELIPKLLAEK
jgi:thiol-disulfide isomerase/thioredoxin